MDNTPHIGNLIKTELGLQQRSVAWLARQIGCSRQNLSRMLSRDYIGTDQLLKISLALRHDFFRCFSDCVEHQN